MYETISRWRSPAGLAEGFGTDRGGFLSRRNFFRSMEKGCGLEPQPAQSFQILDRSHRAPSDAAAQAQISRFRAVLT
jgi:hypothetical protein